MISAVLLGAAALLTTAAAAWTLHVARRGAETGARLMRVAAQLNELQRLQVQIERLTAIQKTTEAVVDGGTAVVRAVHKGIAEIPFSILESIPATRDTTKMVRGIHDLTSDVVYGSISVINKAVGGTLRAGIKSGAVVEKKLDGEKGKGGR